jgi:YVTN family beta-propeller protein
VKRSFLVTSLAIALAACGGAEVAVESPVTYGPSGNEAEVNLVIGEATGAVNEIGSWGEVIPWPFVPVSMAHLPNGKILTYSGSERRTWPRTEQTYSATWDPVTGTFEEKFFSGHNMFCGALTSISDGRVMVTGGRNAGNSPWTTLFDHELNDWQAGPNMASGGRWYPTTLSMGDGTVLSGMGSATNVRNPDLWHPDDGWKVLNGADMVNMRTGSGRSGGNNWFPMLSLAPDGNIFHYWDPEYTHFINTAGSGTIGGFSTSTDNANHGTGVQLMYDAGKLLISGSNDGGWTRNTRNAFIVDLNKPTPEIRATSPMGHPRTFHQLIPLPDGEVLVVGGNTGGAKFNDNGGILEPEIWNPETGNWRGMANMSVVRGYHSTALLLPDARVLVAGGGYSGGDHLDGQVFTPPYLYDANGNLAQRPTISSATESVDVGSSFEVTTTGSVQSFGFVRMSATTHAVNTDSRFYKPQFQSSGNNSWQISIHENPNVATPGYWMLFAIDANGVPSESQIVQVTAVDTRKENFALKGTATQSSDLNNASVASLAIDGNSNGNFNNGSVTHTTSDNQAWWELDLGRTVEIESIRLWNRTDCCGDRLSDFHVLVSSAPFEFRDLAQTQAQQGVTDFAIAGAADSQTDIAINRQGRYVRVQLAGQGILQLAEVQVFGQPRTDITNLALQGTASQSTDYNTTFVADKAIDGNTGGSGPLGQITHTLRDASSWWELDLGDVYDLDSVNIWNRTDCCSNRLSDFYLLVSDTPFNSQDLNQTIAQSGVFSQQFAGAAPRTTEAVIGRTGRYLRVQLPAQNFLQLAEVEVFGAPLATPLTLAEFTPQPQPQSDQVTFTANAEGTAPLQYKWNFGDGSADTAFSTSATASHTYAQPGRYVVSATVRAANGDEQRETFVQVIHAPLTANKPAASAGIIENASRSQLWNVNPDNNSVTVTDTDTLSVLAEIEVGEDPSSLALAPDGRVWVVNRGSATISVIDATSLTVAGSYALTRASHPYGIVFDDTHAYVSLEGTGEVVKIATNGTVVTTAAVGASPRHLSLDSTGQTLYVSRFITPTLPGEDTGSPVVADDNGVYGGEVLEMNASDLSIDTTIVLAHSDRVASEHQGPGVPNYLGAAVISPVGDSAWLPSKQDNILAGALRGGVGITFDQTVRAVTSFIDLSASSEDLDRRVDHDNASVAGHAAYDPFGATLFVTLEGNRQVSIIDTGTATEIGRIDTGRAPQGVLVSDDGTRLYVHNFMDRSIGVYDISEIVDAGGTAAIELATVNAVSNELLNAQVLRGKQLFYDARDDRLASLDYMSCASCHVDGEHDGRVWDFTSLGEGLRNTITLKGRAGMGHGILHWTGNFDELQDFEGQIREFAGGTGLMDDISFAQVSDPLGAPKAGLSEDLDALAAYMSSLVEVSESPYRAADGSLSADAQAGQTLYAANGCADCHSDAIFTDSPTAALHDIGSIMAESGTRLGAALTGLDTPTLLGIWNTGPFLHDGSAATVQDAIAAHLSTTFSNQQLDQLAAYILQLDQSGDNIVPPPPVEPPPVSPVPSNRIAEGAIVVDGALGDWSGLTSFGEDASDTGANNPIDWRESWLAHDNANFYIAYQAHSAVSDSWGYGIYIDVDGDRNTGFRGFLDEYPIGADYIIEAAELQRYTGSGTNWSWDDVATVSRSASGNIVELALPRSLLGDPGAVRLFFRGDNNAVSGDVVDFYPDTVVDASADAESRYLVYSVIESNGNTPPIANSQSVTVASGDTVAVTISGSDVNGDALTFEIVDQPAHGVLTGVAPNLSYQPDANFVGADVFTFNASDGQAQSNLASVTITVQGDSPSNEVTIAVDGNLVDWDSVQSFGLDPADANNLNDTIDWAQGWAAHDADNLYLTYRGRDTLVESWGNSIMLDTDGDRSTGWRGFANEYAIGVDYVIEGRYLMRYTGNGTSWSWSGGDQLPYGLQGTDAELSVSRSQLGNPQSVRLFWMGDNAAVGGSTIDYYPDGVSDANSVVRYFDYALDSEALNRAPVASGQSVQTEQNVALNITLTASDPESASLSYLVTAQPGNGSLSGTAPNLVYTPMGGFTGTDSFAFTASDGVQDSEPAVVSIVVTGDVQPANDVSNPVAGITLAGALADWSGVTPFPSDPADISGEGNLIDWRQAWMAHTDTTLYLAWQNATPVESLSWGHAVYMDTDGQSGTGFLGFAGEFTVGADYVLEGAELFRYTGTGRNWSWQSVGYVQRAVLGDVAEIGIPFASIGNPSSIEFYLFGDSIATGGNSMDLYPDVAADASAPSAARRFGYSRTP